MANAAKLASNAPAGKLPDGRDDIIGLFRKHWPEAPCIRPESGEAYNLAVLVEVVRDRRRARPRFSQERAKFSPVERAAWAFIRALKAERRAIGDAAPLFAAEMHSIDAAIAVAEPFAEKTRGFDWRGEMICRARAVCEAAGVAVPKSPRADHQFVAFAVDLLAIAGEHVAPETASELARGRTRRRR